MPHTFETGEIDTRMNDARLNWVETTCDICESVILASELRHEDYRGEIVCDDCHKGKSKIISPEMFHFCANHIELTPDEMAYELRRIYDVVINN